MKIGNRYYDQASTTFQGVTTVTRRAHYAYAQNAMENRSLGISEDDWNLELSDRPAALVAELRAALAPIKGVRFFEGTRNWLVPAGVATERGEEIAKIFADAGMPILRFNRLDAFPGAEWAPRTKQEWIEAGWTEIT